MTVRTRFAPSPTGYLHIGGARTALFSWLYARQHGGTFILRIEDTDLERSTPESVNAILEGMAWLGLDYDEGPFFQTQRFDRYHEVIQGLLERGHAYRCYCSKERLENLREQQMATKQKPRYDGHCRELNHPPGGDQPYVIRFKTPQQGSVVVNDQIRGRVIFQNHELDDLIIARSDGSPTYNMTVVVDDWEMKITHVIRGDDHLNNTPRQIHILEALGVTPPHYAHVPMILGSDGSRLSKRHGAVSVIQYREDGYLPEAMINYLARLGWSHGDQEIFSREELIQLFDLSAINHAAAAFNPDKLLWLNQHYLKELPLERAVREFKRHLDRQGYDPDQGPDVAAMVTAQRSRAKTLHEMAESSHCFYVAPESLDEAAAKKHLMAEVQAPLQTFRDRLATLESWQAEAIHALLKSVAEEADLKIGKLAQPIRVAMTGKDISPPIDVTVWLIGRDSALARLDKALGYFQS